ncbi:hypothetical protein TIFTF001_027750 [Ficus carica]|uniref:Uncharacterized protein n=1 Tax=Ficus carica TaxID=3494 RepID=A0AA88DNK0_FICCA|nr:hypothetical protein TIFTF001_027750 [Ficus carica]
MDTWHRPIGHTAPERLKPVYPPGTLGGRPDRITRMPEPTENTGLDRAITSSVVPEIFGINMRALAFPATAASPPMLPERPTTIKPCMSEPARTFKALIILLRQAHRAPGDLSVSEALEHSANPHRRKSSSGTSKA